MRPSFYRVMTKSLARHFGPRRVCDLCRRRVKAGQTFTPKMRHVACVRALEK